jgi:hypothetical protein
VSIDWDDVLLGPNMAIFGEGDASQPSALPFYTPRGLLGFPLTDAVFDRAYADVTLEGEDTENSARKPCLGVRISLFPREPAQNDKVYIPSAAAHFIVKDVRLDGHGHARLILMLTTP